VCSFFFQHPERRWVLSGTPTTGDEDSAEFSAKALDQIQRLLVFLRHPIYGTIPSSNTVEVRSQYLDTLRPTPSKSTPLKLQQQAKAAWVTRVKEPFLQKKPEGRTELLEVLRSVMVMHRKEDIHLPKPVFRQGEVSVRIPDAVQNHLQQNALNSATMLHEYLYSDEFQSLVDQAEGDYIVRGIQRAKDDLRERGGPLQSDENAPMKMMNAGDVDGWNLSRTADRRPIKAVVYSSVKNNLRDVTEAIYKALAPENIAEAYDDPGFDCSSELSRFRHNRKECRYCPLCGFQNDCNDQMFKHHGSGGGLKCQNRLLEVVAQSNPRMRFLVEPERVVRAVPVTQGGNVPLERLEGANYSDYGSATRVWKVGDVLEVDVRDPHPLLKKRKSFETWEAYGVQDCMDFAERDYYRGTDWFFGPLPHPSDAGSDNDEGDSTQTMQVVLAKWQLCGRYHNPSRWYRGPRLIQSPVETIHEDVFVLALDAGLAHGLDLSFVTHIFLLEPVEDAALLEQITSRAHRLGATGPVTVETMNPFYLLDSATESLVELSKQHKQWQKQDSRQSSSVAAASSGNRKDLIKEVCEYCYRQFDSKAAAEDHEKKQCPRNPTNISMVDPWHLSSVYRELRPPPRRVATARHEEER